MNHKMSLYDYKIDFNDYLGAGTFGAVYGVVKRPQREKNLISYLVPYLHDYIFRVPPIAEYEKTKYCIKILDPEDFRFHLIFTEPQVQFESSLILRKKNLSTVEYIKSNSCFSYFKTRIQGKNLYKIPLYEKDGFKKRFAWVQFSQAIIHSHLKFFDLKRDNIMYDEVNEKWEIIDGSVKELNPNEKTDNLEKLNDLFYCPIDQYVSKKLTIFASKKIIYLNDHDQKIIGKVESKFKKQLAEKQEESINLNNPNRNFSEVKIKSILQNQAILTIFSLSLMIISIEVSMILTR